MNPELQAFARQLATWTELVIENGRTPFRRVDLFPAVHTAQGVLQPPLIFWINRQSMMAGGILLLPEQDLATELQRGRSIAEALGLRHFVTWESDQLRIWELRAATVEVHQQFAFPGSNDPDSYRHLLSKLLEALKLLAVLGLVPAAELSANYLHNLFQTTLEIALPPLVNSFRSQRAREDSQRATDADQAAVEAARLTLLQLLTLLWHQQLPGSILPEKLERAIDLSLPNLPEHLQQPLTQKVFQEQPALPYETAVCFHHLLLRLRQIGWKQPQLRARNALENLIGSWYPEANTCDLAQICLYPQTPRLTSSSQLIVSDSAVLLAAVALLDDLHQQPIRQQVFGSIFNLQLPTAASLTIGGQLENQNSPSREERQQFDTLLRNSWPNRRFRLPSGSPLWLWETLHLLGLGKKGCELSLRLPLEALQTAAEDPLWTVVTEAYSLQSVQLLENSQLKLELSELTASAPIISIETATQTRDLSPAKSAAVQRSQILLALQLPEAIYRLLDHELSWPPGQAVEIPEQVDLQLYSRSRLGQGLWKLLSVEPIPGTASALSEAACRLGWPIPQRDLLGKLARTIQDTAEAPPADLDQILAELLDCPAVADFVLQSGAPQEQRFSREQLSHKELREELVQQLQAEGIPTFPEQYLYFLEAPQMLRYQLRLPLEIVSEFLGQIELRDAAGQQIQVYGEEQAKALLLCAELEKTEVELPADRQQVSLLLDHYKQDLQQLYQQLNSLCYSRQEDAKVARKLVRKIWKKLHVPSLKWLKD